MSEATYSKFETKDLVDIIKNENISHDEYSCEMASGVINKILLQIYSEIESLIKKIDKEKLNLLLLYLYSSVLCDMQEVYRGSNRKDEKLLEEHERMNTCILSIKRLIIDNININDNKDDNDINDKDIDFLIKKSKHYIILKSYFDIIDTIIKCKDYMPQDICDYIKLTIEKDFSLKIYEDDSFCKYDKEVLSDKYNNHNFKPNKESCESFAKNFKKDTKFYFSDFLAVLYYMGNIISNEYKHLCIHKNDNIISVHCMELKTILSKIKDISSFKNNINFFNLLNIKKTKINKNNINKIIDFIISECNYKYSLAINMNNKIIFSPLCIKHYYKLWDNAVNDFDIPSHCKMENTNKTLEKIKKECEKRIESDVNNLISGYNFITKQNIKLAINDRKKDNYYKELGEFDVVGINVNKHKILLIECKYIKNDNTPSSFIYRYKNFFGVKEYHKKFIRRINYVKNNCQDFLKFYFSDSNIDISINYDIESYMVVNRPFAQKFHNFNDFKIVSFNQFEEICKQNYK